MKWINNFDHDYDNYFDWSVGWDEDYVWSITPDGKVVYDTLSELIIEHNLQIGDVVFYGEQEEVDIEETISQWKIKQLSFEGSPDNDLANLIQETISGHCFQSDLNDFLIEWIEDNKDWEYYNFTQSGSHTINSNDLHKISKYS